MLQDDIQKSNDNRLCDRISEKGYWSRLHQVAIQAVTTAGMAAMGFYRQALPWPTDYAQNSGVVAMADVARGALGGFVNIVTNLWDVAAGEVLVRACRGQVTDFAGAPITYASTEQTSVVAAKAHLHAQILDILAG